MNSSKRDSTVEAQATYVDSFAQCLIDAPKQKV